jgi:hypothetical protein
MAVRVVGLVVRRLRYVVALNYRQAVEAARENKWGREGGDWKYVSSARDLHGARPASIEFAHGWYLRSDAYEIELAAASVKAKQPKEDVDDGS